MVANLKSFIRPFHKPYFIYYADVAACSITYVHCTIYIKVVVFTNITLQGNISTMPRKVLVVAQLLQECK